MNLGTTDSVRLFSPSLFSASLVLFPEGAAHADDDKELPLEHTIVARIGGATEYELGGGSILSGGNVMVEWDAIENWLELEVSASLLAADNGV